MGNPVEWRKLTNHKIPCNYVNAFACLSSLVMTSSSRQQSDFVEEFITAGRKRTGGVYIITWNFVIGRFAPFNGIPQTVILPRCEA